jgi:hypothetical protein
MQRLPSPEERDWLAASLRQLTSRGGLLAAAPLVEPTNEWFPEPWAMTATHGHRLAQRLMHYAGLGKLRISLDAYDPEWSEEDAPWDAGTAGWFAGIEDGRARFGLHVDQFDDPEKAAGVLAHEVAHAWRAHHGLVVGDRDEEEHLTDLTTIALGFGILTTNNTDRYRASGTWDETSWTISSAGYLPPQAMAYALALWCEARGDDGERRAIEKHLEPNQLACFRAAVEELGDATALLGDVSAGSVRRVTPAFTPVDPRGEEISEPEYEDDGLENAGEMVYRKSRGETFWLALFGMFPGAIFGAIVAGIAFRNDPAPIIAGCAALTGAFSAWRSRRTVCSECNTPAPAESAVCSGCGGSFGRVVTERELQRIREEEMEANAARDVGYEECDACEPEVPCPAHGGAQRFV